MSTLSQDALPSLSSRFRKGQVFRGLVLLGFLLGTSNGFAGADESAGPNSAAAHARAEGSGGSSDPEKAEETPKRPLTLERIFSSKEFSEASDGHWAWTPDGNGFHVLEAASTPAGGQDIVRYQLPSGRREVVVPSHALIPLGATRPLSIDAFEFSKNADRVLIYTQSQRVWRMKTRGDYWILDVTGRELRKLGEMAEPSSLQFAQFSPDGRNVAYVYRNNLFVQDLLSLDITGLTYDGDDSIINGTFDWVYEEELGLRRGFEWSPDGKHLAYWQLDTRGVQRFVLVNNTDGLYQTFTEIPYPKTGQVNSAARIGVLPVGGGETYWLPLGDDPRNTYPARLSWLPSGDALWVQQFNRLQNTNSVLLFHPRDNTHRELWQEIDAAWVDNKNPPRPIFNGTETLWLSERVGWRHIYRANLTTGEMRRLTSGELDVLEIEGVHEKDGWVYFSASPENPAQRYLYRVSLEGGAVERVTPEDSPGTHTYSLSPNGRWALHAHSRFDVPPKSQWIRLANHEPVLDWRDNQSLRDELAELDQPELEFFRIRIDPFLASVLEDSPVAETVDLGFPAQTSDSQTHRLELDGWCLRPPDFHASKKYPVLFHVYGEPAGQTVLDRWRKRNLLWHWMLAQQGYVIISVDNRGTPAPRGRSWRKAAYRQVGILTAAEQAAAVRALCAQWTWLDPDRIGVWGWSGGGSMTLNLLFQYPGIYHMGISIAPVPNQRLYDTIYQERYMGLPDDNVSGYRLGSPITHAHRLQGDLLVIHGTGDDNCHYQGAEALFDELIAHNRPFEMMAYPNRSHAISEGAQTSRHLYELMTRFIQAHLPGDR